MRSKLMLCSRIFYALWALIACLAVFALLPETDFYSFDGVIMFCALTLVLLSAFLTPLGLFCRGKGDPLFHIGTGLYILFYLVIVVPLNASLSLFLITFFCLLPDLCGELFLLLKKKKVFLFISSIVLNGACFLVETAVIVVTVCVFTLKPADIEGNVVFVWLVMSICALFNLMHRLGFFFCLLDARKHRPHPAAKVENTPTA